MYNLQNNKVSSMKYLSYFIIAAVMGSSLAACNDDDVAKRELDLILRSHSFSDGTEPRVHPNTPYDLTLDFNCCVEIANANGITVNGQQTSAYVTPGNRMQITVPMILQEGSEYEVNIAEGSLNVIELGENYSFSGQSPAFAVNFKTKQSPDVYVTKTLSNSNATTETKALYDLLLGYYCKKTLTAMMADVAWNNDYSEQINHWTGKYPAINGYDFIHLPSDGTWIDYSDITPVQEWHNAGGIVTIMWHWNVPTEEPQAEPEPSTGDGVLASEEKVMPSDWSGSYKIEASSFASAKEGDVITAQTKDVAAGAQGSFKDGSSWSGLVDGNGVSYDYFDITGDFTLTLDSKLLEAIQANGLIISGHDYTLTGVTLASAQAKPLTASQIEYTVNPDETDFKADSCLVEGTWENTVWKNDLAKVAAHLKELQAAGIPVLWRPFHEAKGNYDVYEEGTGAWFWWGAAGPEVFKELWVAMYDYMKAEGLNNLIWVWTDIPDYIDSAWYPGDEYVDIVGVDIYNKKSVIDIFDKLCETYPSKMITLSECGNVPTVGDMFNAFAEWSWAMPWYNGPDAEHATREWWEATMSSEYAVTRDQLK